MGVVRSAEVSTRHKPREAAAWAPLPVRARDVPAWLPKGPCVLQIPGKGGAWVTLSRHHTGLAALAERDRRRVWPNRIVPNEQLRAAVTHVWMLPPPLPAVEADVLATLPVEGRR